VSVVNTDINIPEYIQDDLIGEMDLIKKPGQTINYRHTGKAIVHLDHHLLWSILTNLISNAIKYSRNDSVITVLSEINDETLSIKVEDNGIGIPADEHKKHLRKILQGAQCHQYRRNRTWTTYRTEIRGVAKRADKLRK